MEIKSNIIILALNLFFTFLGTCCLLIGILGESWLVKPSTKTGLWRTCNTTDCTQDSDLFSFNEERHSYDIVFLLLIMASIAGVISIFFILIIICCCKQNRRGWKIFAVPNVLFNTIAGLISLIAMIYAEVSFKSELIVRSSRGWSFIGGWIGAFLFVVTFILSIIVFNSKKVQSTEVIKFTNTHGKYLKGSSEQFETFGELTTVTERSNNYDSEYNLNVRRHLDSNTGSNIGSAVESNIGSNIGSVVKNGSSSGSALVSGSKAGSNAGSNMENGVAIVPNYKRHMLEQLIY